MVNRVIPEDKFNNLTIPVGNTEISLFNNFIGKRCTFFNRIPLSELREQNYSKSSNLYYDRWNTIKHDGITCYKNTGYTTADRIGDRVDNGSQKSIYMLLLNLVTNTSPRIGLVYRILTCTFFNRILREKKCIFQQDFASVKFFTFSMGYFFHLRDFMTYHNRRFLIESFSFLDKNQR